jgi:tonB-linked outer membrane protein, susC/ragA family
MKKNRNEGNPSKWVYLKKMILVMKLTCFFTLLLLFQVSAASYSQKRVNLNVEGVSMLEVIKELRQQTGFKFFFNHNELEKVKEVSAKFEDEELEKVLDVILGKVNLAYRIEQGVIIIVPSKANDEKKIVRVVGRVTDEDKQPLPGVTVKVTNLSLGTVTNTEGRYQLVIPNAPEKFSLLFSFIGMVSREIAYTGKDTVDVVMKEDVATLDEVVVTGYQTIKKKEMVGSTQTVKREDLFFDGTNSLEQMLQGKLSGMLVMNTSGLVGSRQKVRVRGTSTLLGNQEPVWVVDGIIQEDPLPFDTQELNSLGTIDRSNFDMVKDFVGNAISWLNPNDIEDITILKDASATVLYGVKAANGVIVITTKKGEKGRLSVNYSGGMSMTPRLTYGKARLMNSKERIEVSREIYESGLLGNSALEEVGYEGVLKRYLNKEISYSEFDTEVKKLETLNTDWFDILYQDAMSHNHSVSVSGGAERFRYYASMNAQFQKGTAKGNESESYSASLNVDSELHPKVILGVKLSGSFKTTEAFYKTDPYNYALRTSRAIPCFDENGEYFYYKARNGYMYNILNEVDQTGNKNDSRGFNVNINLKYDILEGLRYETVLGLAYNNTVGESYATELSHYITAKRQYEFGTARPEDDLYKASPLPHGGELNRTENRNWNYTWRNSISYSRVFDLHRVSFMVGQESRSTKYDGASVTTFGYLPGRGKTSVTPPLTYVVSGRTITNTSIYDQMRTVITDRKSNYVSFYATATYSFDQRYVFTASARTDASNRFGQDTRNRFLPVWSLGLRWNVTDEAWMKNQNIVSELNFRGAYGWQGNVAENYGPDLIARIPSPGISSLTGDYLLAIKSLPYGDLRWEKTKTINLEAEMGLFDGKVLVSASYYRKKTIDMIVEKGVPSEYGVTSMPVNGGDMLNRGWELSVSLTPVRTKDFVWSLSMNTSKNTNKIESTMSENKSWRSAVGGNINKEGYAVSSFWAFEFLGLNPDTGVPVLNIPTKEENPDALDDATAYMKYAGKTEPDFQGGLSTSFRYKTLVLSAGFNLNVGGKKFLYQMYDDMEMMGLPSAYYNLSSDLINRWKKPGDEKFTNIPCIPSSGIGSQTMPNGSTEPYPRLYNYTDVRVVNASFLRCNNIKLSYTFPERIAKYLHLKNLSISGGVTNPFIIMSSKYKGMDPEVNTGSQPISRNYSVSLNISL